MSNMPIQTSNSRLKNRQNAVLSKGRSMLLPLIAIGVILGAGMTYWVWHGRNAQAGDASQSQAGVSGGAGKRFGGARDSQPVSVQAAKMQDIQVTVNAIGSITASNTAVVHAQVNGILQSINFREGQQVNAGQLLASIDPRAVQATLVQAEGALARDTAQLENARMDLVRYRDLMAKDAIAKQQLDTQQALVRQLEGTVKVDQGAVAGAQLQLSYTRVLAPISGRVGLKQVDLGNVVQPADPAGIVSITQTRPVSLVFAVPAAQVPLISARLRANQTLGVEAWDRSGVKQLAIGKVATIDNAIDASTDTIKVKALFANTDDSLFPNQSVSVRLQLDTKKNALTVAQAAVLRGAQGFYVYVVNQDGTVSTRVIRPGVVDKGWMAIEGNVKAGESVVIDGVDRLRDGTKVEVIDGTKRVAPKTDSQADVGADKRQQWLDSLSPQDKEKFQSMTPEERKAWRQSLRQQTGETTKPSASPAN